MLGDVDAGVEIEVVNLNALVAYAALEKDRRLRQLRTYIRFARRDGYIDERFPGMVCFAVRYVRKHGFPGRRYAIGCAVQSLTREARAIAFGVLPAAEDLSIAFDVDLKNSIPSCCARLARRLGLDEHCTVLMKYVEHVDEWKSAVAEYYELTVDEAKRLILKVFFGGAPPDENPMLWGLIRDVSTVRDAVLAEYLTTVFTSRPRPTITRFAYALFAEEDALLRKLIHKITETMPTAHISALIFDGCVVTFPSSEPTTEGDLDAVLESFAIDFAVTPTIKPWNVPDVEHA